MQRTRLAVAVTAFSVTLLSGCATMDQNKGKIVGGIGGALIGALACKGDVRCAIAGGVAGVVLGDLWDKRQKALEEAARQNNINLESRKVSVKTGSSSDAEGMEVSVQDDAMFMTGHADLTAASKTKLRAIARAYKDHPQKLLIIGHTDATGADDVNLRLSLQRAKTVARLFAAEGIPQANLYYQGAGESQPIATNDTEAGRAINRRVDIVEMTDTNAIAAYNLQRQTDSRYLEHSNATKEEKKSVEVAVDKKAPAAPATSTPTPVKVYAKASQVVDFGGTPATNNNPRLLTALGGIKPQGGGASLFSKAYADDGASYTPCYMNKPREVSDVESLSDGKPLQTSLPMSQYWPGLNGNVWLDEDVNGHLLALTDLKLRAETGNPVGEPTFSLYKNYVKGSKSPADYKLPAHVESYVGDKGLLLRAYFDKQAPVACMDIVMANSTEYSAKTAELYYPTTSALFEREIKLHRIN